MPPTPETEAREKVEEAKKLLVGFASSPDATIDEAEAIIVVLQQFDILLASHASMEARLAESETREARLVEAALHARDDLGRAADLLEHAGHREVAMRTLTTVDYIRAALTPNQGDDHDPA